MKLMKILLLVALPFVVIRCTAPETDTYERFYFRTDGADLAVQVDGNKNSDVFILLIHGGPGGSGYEYNIGTYADMLEEQYAMVYLDQRGQGASYGQYNDEDVTLQQFSDDIYNLVKFLKAKYGTNISVFLLGHSWGGTTSSHSLLNTKVEDDIKGWIQVDGAHDIPLLNKAAIKMYLEYASQEIDAGNNVDEWTKILEFAEGVDTNNITNEDAGSINSFGHDAEGYLVNAEEQEYSPPSHSLLTMPTLSLAAYFGGNITANLIHEETEALSVTNELKNVTTPTLLLWGKYDFVVPPRLAFTGYNNLGTAIADKKVVIFDNSGHSPMVDQPVEFVSEVTDFIEVYK